MKYLLSNNRSTFNSTYRAGLNSQIWVPLNNGRSVGPDINGSIFKTTPDTDAVKLTDWVSNQLQLGNISVPPALVDNNGLISTLPEEPVSIDSADNDLAILNLGVFEFSNADTIGLKTEGAIVTLGDISGSGSDYSLGLVLDLDEGRSWIGATVDYTQGTNIEVRLGESLLLLRATDIGITSNSEAEPLYYLPTTGAPPEDGEFYVIRWTNGTPTFEIDQNGIYSGSGFIPDATQASLLGTFEVRGDTGRFSNLWSVENSDLTWNITTYAGFSEATAFINVYTHSTNETPPSITLSVDDTSTGVTSVISLESTGIQINTNGELLLIDLPTYADDTAAGVGGLSADAVYKTATGELRIKL